jgi:arsenical pump membrane protein
MWPAFVAAVVVTIAFVVWVPRHRREPRIATGANAPARGTVVTTRLGVVAVAAILTAVVLMLTLADPAAPVLAVGLIAGAVEVMRRRMPAARALDTVDPALLLGLFGVAVALGTLGRTWHWPSHVLASANAGGTATIAAAASVLLNNLPSAALLAARPVPHARALLVGLNLGPNLAVTGSLSALLWYRTARTVGARPRLTEVTRLGVVLVPLSIAAALLALRFAGSGAL